MRLKDKVAIVTGAGRGIGLVTAQTFAREGAKVVLCDLDLPEVEAAAAEISQAGGQALAVQANTAKTASVQDLLAKVLAHFGRVDILVNNAGIIRDKQLLKMEEADFDTVIEVNLKGVYLCTRTVAEVMAAQGGGVILNASSVVALYGGPGQVNYSASKAGLVGIARSITRELGSRGITANVVAPGFVDTDMTRALPEKTQEQYKAAIPAKRFGTVDDIAAATLFLASPGAAYISGAVLPVDGGLGMGH